jgi:hypothetical protein
LLQLNSYADNATSPIGNLKTKMFCTMSSS